MTIPRAPKLSTESSTCQWLKPEAFRTFQQWENATNLYGDTYSVERVRTHSPVTQVPLISSEAEDLVTFVTILVSS